MALFLRLSEYRQRMGRIKKGYSTPGMGRILGCLSVNLYRERKRCDLSQQKLAELAGITVSTVSEIERLRATNIELGTLVSIADALKIEVTDLLSG